jgi:ABC-type molybdate transport system substrate-binding protein
VYSLQPAGEAQSVPAGYQTDTRHSRAGLWDTGWTTGGTGKRSCLRGNVPAHAETTEQLHTLPPGDKTVQLTDNLSFPLISGETTSSYT